MDGQFDFIHGDIADIWVNLNVCSNNKHVVGNWATQQNNKGKASRDIQNLAALVVFWINTLPPGPSIAGDLSPQQIIAGMMVYYAKHFQLHFREYAQLHKLHDNIM